MPTVLIVCGIRFCTPFKMKNMSWISLYSLLGFAFVVNLCEHNFNWSHGRQELCFTFYLCSHFRCSHYALVQRTFAVAVGTCCQTFCNLQGSNSRHKLCMNWREITARFIRCAVLQVDSMHEGMSLLVVHIVNINRPLWRLSWRGRRGGVECTQHNANAWFFR